MDKLDPVINTLRRRVGLPFLFHVEIFCAIIGIGMELERVLGGEVFFLSLEDNA
jgi:hypothetical protein